MKKEIAMLQGYNEWYRKRTKKREHCKIAVNFTLLFLLSVSTGNHFFTVKSYESHYANYFCTGRVGIVEIGNALMSLS